MSARMLKREQSATRFSTLEQNNYLTSNGQRKRTIYYNVDYTEEEERWIGMVRNALRKEKGVDIKEDQVILRYYYSADLNLQKCLQRLVKYNEWFNNPQIQKVSESAKSIFREGFIYSYGVAQDGRGFLIMNLSKINMDKYSQISYYQAINYAINKVIKEDFIPGSIQTYHIILDLDEKLLGLPLSSLSDIIKVLSNAYSMCLQKMMIINCTTLSKWIYNRVASFISEETVKKISLFTKDDLSQGKLKDLIEPSVLERKYGGLRPNYNFHHYYRERIMGEEERTQTEFFTIEDNQEYTYYSEGSCCGMKQECNIY